MNSNVKVQFRKLGKMVLSMFLCLMGLYVLDVPADFPTWKMGLAVVLIYMSAGIVWKTL